MNWTKEPGEKGWYFVVHKGEVYAARHDLGPYKLTPNPYPVQLVGTGFALAAAEFTAWCRIPDPPPLPPDLQ